jgi:hypothetical protein
MDFVTSRGYVLPETADGLAGAKFFNLWSKRLWPYNALEVGDVLHWYESPNKCVVWRSRVTAVIRFPYQRKDEVRPRLQLRIEEAGQPHYTNAPDAGYCLSCKVEAVERVCLPKPDGFRFPQSGWLRVNEEVAAAWPELASGVRGDRPDPGAAADRPQGGNEIVAC